MDFGKTLKVLREKLVLSQTEMAELLDVSFVSVNRWENGKHEPSYKTKRKIIALCEKYNIQTR
jgi:DNA-binding XRE family transcriptional regulator